MKALISIATLLLICNIAFALFGYGETDVFTITETTLPVELSSFTATITAQNYVRLQWTTQSETNLLGYYVYRAETDEAAGAIKVSSLISATNSSSQINYSFEDMELTQNGMYYYWLYSMEVDGTGYYHGPVSVDLSFDGGQSTPDIPVAYGLTSIFPNPFNPNANIVYQIKNPASVKLEVFNARGQLVNSLHRDHPTPGQFTWHFTGEDKNGNPLSSGVYNVVMSYGNTTSVRKMVLMK